MEELRRELYEFIEMYGPLDSRTVEISQKLDLFIVEEMKSKNNHLEYQN